jgi:methylated-DNA-[protein]-cysteine S-methyltransferase
VPLVVPCHRVVAAQGLGGFSGQTRGERLAVKQRLLDHERAHRR